MVYSENPTEDQLLSVFKTEYGFKVMRELMKSPKGVPEIANALKQKNYGRIYAAISHLKLHGLIRIKEYRMAEKYKKEAVFAPTVKNIIVNMNSEETTVRTDTKLVLHSEDFEQ